MSDLIRKHFDYGQLWPLWPACSQKMAELYIPDPTSRIQFGSVFPEKAWTILCKPNSDLIWMAWSGLGQIHPVLKQAGVQKPLAPVSGRMQHARDQFPRFQTRLHSSTDGLDHAVQNQAGSSLVLADCVRFWPNGSGPEASWCARIIWPTSGQCFQADPDWMQIESSMFTGYAAQNLVQRLF